MSSNSESNRAQVNQGFMSAFGAALVFDQTVAALLAVVAVKLGSLNGGLTAWRISRLACFN